MQKKIFTILGLALAAIPPAPAQNILLSGNSMTYNPGLDSALSSLGATYTAVASQNFGTTSLVGYNLVWLDGFSQFSPGTPGNPGLSAANLMSFMNAGGVVLVQNPGFGSESLSQYPLGGSLSAQFTYPPGENTIRLTDTSSPLNAGLTGASLSGWNPSAYGIINSGIGSFTGVTDNGTTGDWVTISQSVGAGELIYTEQGISEQLYNNPGDPNATRLLENVISTATPEPGTVALFGAAGVVALMRRFRR